LPPEAQTLDPTTSSATSGHYAVNRRPRWRDAIARGLYYSGALRILLAVSRHYEFAPSNGRRLPFLRRADGPKHAILCYHRIGTGGIPLFNGLPPEIFEAQMQFIRRRYRVVSLDSLCDEMEKPARDGHTVAVTFDDGYRDLYTYALPALQKYRIPATIFLPVAAIETGQVPWYDRVFLTLKVFPADNLEILLDRPRSFRLASYEVRLQVAAEIIGYLRTIPDARRREFCTDLEGQVTLPSEELTDRMLTWNQIRAMCRAGITFESHTMTHPVVSQLTAGQLESELRDSKHILAERTRRPVQHFAFPFGQPRDCGAAAIPVLLQAGYRSAATTVEGINAPGDNLFRLRRVQIGDERSLAMFAFKLNQLFFSAVPVGSATASPACPPHGQAYRDSLRATN
jgi:peptidoglycan/xylan/chitin deacetylase (PgdA/CDA1 family)